VRQQVQTTRKIADSFSGMDQFAEAPTTIQKPEKTPKKVEEKGEFWT
jgi:hypothetical protein